MTMSSTADHAALGELSKLISRSTTNDVLAYNMAGIEETVGIGGILNAPKREIAIEKDIMYVLTNGPGKITYNMDDIIKEAQ